MYVYIANLALKTWKNIHTIEYYLALKRKKF